MHLIRLTYMYHNQKIVALLVTFGIVLCCEDFEYVSCPELVGEVPLAR